MAKKKKNLCDKCTGLCCRYIALPIENPETREEHEDIRWYLCHEDIAVFVEDDEWYINIKNKCKYLCENEHHCKIYDKRPKICRKYRTKDCEFTSDEYGYDMHFTDDKQMEEYIKIKFDNNITDTAQKNKKSKKVKKNKRRKK